MQSEFINIQSNWLNQTDELNDNEAAQVNGGASLVGTSELGTNAVEAQIMGLTEQSANIALAGAQAGLITAQADAIGGAADAAGEASSDAGDRVAVQ